MVKIDYTEHGTPGLEANFGFITQAYNTDLTWPTVQPLFSRLRRSDPEMTIVRNLFLTLARELQMSWSVPQEYQDNKAAQDAVEFGNSVLEDLDGGQDRFIETLVSHVPFMGWGWWDAVPCVRSPEWKPPDDDNWRSSQTDGKIGFRRFAWRDTSSFKQWDIEDKTGRLFGMVQHDFPNIAITLPLDRSIHITFGDSNNPEGLSPLEAVWRLERIKYGLEVVHGIGSEHAAGYLDITAEDKLSDADKVEVKAAARAILTAQEGNYAAWPKGVKGEIKDISFSAGPAILEAIRYYGILKLMVFSAQYVALSSISGAGSYAAGQDSSAMFMMFFNAMVEGFVNQLDRQIGPRLFEQYNQFPGLEVRPKLMVNKLEKEIELDKMSTFLQAFKLVSDLTEDDIEAIRKRSRFLPEQPTGDIVVPQGTQGAEPDEEEPAPEEDDGQLSQLSHDAALVNHMCPLCGNSQAFNYPDHKGLLVCTACARTYDPSKE